MNDILQESINEAMRELERMDTYLKDVPPPPLNSYVSFVSPQENGFLFGVRRLDSLTFLHFDKNKKLQAEMSLSKLAGNFMLEVGSLVWRGEFDARRRPSFLSISETNHRPRLLFAGEVDSRGQPGGHCIFEAEEGCVSNRRRAGVWRVVDEITEREYWGEVKMGGLDEEAKMEGYCQLRDEGGTPLVDGFWKDGKFGGVGRLHEKGYVGELTQDMVPGRVGKVGGYTGEFLGWKKEGIGKEVEEGEVYIGDWKNGSREGMGFCSYQNQGKYLGGWAGGKRKGLGIYLNESREMKAVWDDGELNGLCLVIAGNKRVLGQYERGKLTDVIKDQDGSLFEMQFEKEQFTGFFDRVSTTVKVNEQRVENIENLLNEAKEKMERDGSVFMKNSTIIKIKIDSLLRKITLIQDDIVRSVHKICGITGKSLKDSLQEMKENRYKTMEIKDGGVSYEKLKNKSKVNLEGKKLKKIKNTSPEIMIENDNEYEDDYEEEGESFDIRKSVGKKNRNKMKLSRQSSMGYESDEAPKSPLSNKQLRAHAIDRTGNGKTYYDYTITNERKLIKKKNLFKKIQRNSLIISVLNDLKKRKDEERKEIIESIKHEAEEVREVIGREKKKKKQRTNRNMGKLRSLTKSVISPIIKKKKFIEIIQNGKEPNQSSELLKIQEVMVEDSDKESVLEPNHKKKKETHEVIKKVPDFQYEEDNIEKKKMIEIMDNYVSEQIRKTTIVKPSEIIEDVPDIIEQNQENKITIKVTDETEKEVVSKPIDMNPESRKNSTRIDQIGEDHQLTTQHYDSEGEMRDPEKEKDQKELINAITKNNSDFDMNLIFDRSSSLLTPRQARPVKRLPSAVYENMMKSMAEKVYDTVGIWSQKLEPYNHRQPYESSDDSDEGVRTTIRKGFSKNQGDKKNLIDPNIQALVLPDGSHKTLKRIQKISSIDLNTTTQLEYMGYLSRSRFLKHELPRGNYISLCCNQSTNTIYTCSTTKLLSYTLEEFELVDGPSKELAGPKYINYHKDQLIYFVGNDIIFADGRLNVTNQIEGRPGASGWQCGVASHDKQIWPGSGNSISLIRLEDFKKKGYKDFWNPANGQPIYAEYCSRLKKIVGIEGSSTTQDFKLVAFDTISKERSQMSLKDQIPDSRIRSH